MNEEPKDGNPKETWEARYAAGRMPDFAPHALVAAAAARIAPGCALDLACGAGRNAVFLAAEGFRVTAVDYALEGLARARAKAAEAGVAVDFRAADLERGEFTIDPGAYDLICAVCYLQRDLFAAIKAGVRAGGLVVAVTLLRAPGAAGDFALEPGELRGYFTDFEILHDRETAPENARPTAEILARRPAEEIGI